MWKGHIPKLNKKKDKLFLLLVLKVVRRADGIQSNKGGHREQIHNQALEINTKAVA